MILIKVEVPEPLPVSNSGQESNVVPLSLFKYPMAPAVDPQLHDPSAQIISSSPSPSRSPMASLFGVMSVEMVVAVPNVPVQVFAT